MTWLKVNLLALIVLPVRLDIDMSDDAVGFGNDIQKCESTAQQEGCKFLKRHANGCASISACLHRN
jgi:hypothetical protein